MTKAHEVVQEALRKQGLPTLHEGVHTLRRAVARHFFNRQVEEIGYDGALRTTSALLHHSSSATTEAYLGMSSERLRRDDALRGKSFLTAMVPAKKADNVVPLRKQS